MDTIEICLVACHSRLCGVHLIAIHSLTTITTLSHAHNNKIESQFFMWHCQLDNESLGCVCVYVNMVCYCQWMCSIYIDRAHFINPSPLGLSQSLSFPIDASVHINYTPSLPLLWLFFYLRLMSAMSFHLLVISSVHHPRQHLSWLAGPCVCWHVSESQHCLEYPSPCPESVPSL